MNEYTKSVVEMIVTFAQNESIAQVVGMRTPGEIVAAANFHARANY